MRSRSFQLVVLVIACCCALLSSAFGQDATPKPTQEQLNQLLQRLQSPSSGLRISAAEELSRMGASAVSIAPRIAALLKNRDIGIRDSAAVALGRIGAAAVSTAPALVEALKDNNNVVRFSAAHALGHIGSAAASVVPNIAALLKDNDASVRSAAAEALKSLGSAAASTAPALVESLKDRDSGVRNSVANALGNMGPAAAAVVPNIVELLKDPDSGIRYDAAEALGSIGPAAASAVPALTALLKDKDYQARSAAAEALGKMGAAAAAATPALIEALKDTEGGVYSQAISALTQIGPAAASAVPALAELLKGRDSATRSDAAVALGKMGSAAAGTAPALVELLKDKDSDVRDNAASALSSIATGVENGVPKYRYSELVQAITIWQNIQKRLDAVDSKSTSDPAKLAETQQSVHRLVSALQREQQSRVLERAEDWLAHNKVLAGFLAYLLLVVGVNGLLLAFWPIGLLRINEGMKKVSDVPLPALLSGFKVPVSWVLGFGLLQSNKRVLNAWVKKHADAADKQLRSADTFMDREAYVALDALLNGAKTTITPAALQPLFAGNRATLLLWGEGGSGKTTLACQMALWALADTRSGRLCESHRMLPVFIEENLAAGSVKDDALLLNVIGRRIQQLTGEAKPPSDDLLRNLLETKRILLIVDGLSERDTATRSLFLAEGNALPLNALVVTSRAHEEFPNAKPQTIQTRLLGVDQVAGFLQQYLTALHKPDLLTDTELSTSLARFYQLVGQHEITVLLARLYAQYMIDCREGTTAQRIHNVPELMAAYVNALCSKIENPPYPLHEIHEMARIIAWEVVKTTLTPGEVGYADAESALAAPREDGKSRPYQSNPRAALTFFVDTLHLLQKRGLTAEPGVSAPTATEERLKFALDPPSEYLAARHLVESLHRDDKARWVGFFISPAANPTNPKSIAGFILALYDTMNAFGKDGDVKAYVLSELQKRFDYIRPTPQPSPELSPSAPPEPPVTAVISVVTPQQV